MLLVADIYTYQLLQVVVSSYVFVVEEDLRHSSSPRPLFHLVAALGVLLQVHVHVGHLEIAQQLLGSPTERTCRYTENQDLTEKDCHLGVNVLRLWKPQSSQQAT